MQYIICGAGINSRRAFYYLGAERVSYFAAFAPEVKVWEGKVVLTAEEAIRRNDEQSIYVIADSGKAAAKWAELIRAASITKCFVFSHSDLWEINSVLPSSLVYKHREFVNYTRLLAKANIETCKRIAVLGTNRFVHYLIAEIAMQNKFEHIVGVVRTNDGDCNTLGIPEINFEDLAGNIDCLIVNVDRPENVFCEQLEQTKNYRIIELYHEAHFIQYEKNDALAKFRNIHRGKRCFIIGNGPSMRLEDLETLHRNHEICFGANKIYRIYDQTKWRADYYGLADYRGAMDCMYDLDRIPGELFIGEGCYEYELFHSVPVNRFHVIREDYYPNYPRFSADITRGCYAGNTITYQFGIQVAAYMGFSEIYLLGVDHSYTSADITAEDNHFIKDYYRIGERDKYSEINPICTGEEYKWEWQTKAYEAAELYSREHGFRIYNATRGGCLEVFERVNFDSLWK